MKRLVGLLLCALLGLTACTGSNAVDQNQKSTFQFGIANPSGKTILPKDRKKVADFTGDLIGGGTYKLSEDAGKVVVVNFWAAWCGPCQAETPQFSLLSGQLASQGVRFVGIDIKDARSAAESFIKDNDIKYPIVYDEPGQTALELGNLPTQGLPFTLLIDRQQRVAAVYIGPQSPKDLKPALTTLAKEA